MPDVPRLLHPGHPESPDDRPEQPGDGQEHPARVCLHSLHGTHRHIVTPGAPILSVSSLSPLCAIIMDKHLPSTFLQGHKYMSKGFTLRSSAAFTSYQEMKSSAGSSLKHSCPKSFLIMMQLRQVLCGVSVDIYDYLGVLLRQCQVFDIETSKFLFFFS